MASRGPFSESRTFFRPPEASTMASGDGKKPPRQPKSAPSSPRWPHDCPRSPQEAPRAFRDDFQGGPKKPKSLIFIVFFSVFRVLAFSGCRHSKTAQEASNIAPRGPQEAPKTAQEGPTTAQEAPKTAQESFKTAPREAQEGEHRPTIRAFRPKRPPRGPKTPPRGLKSAPRDSQDALREHLGAILVPSWGHLGTSWAIFRDPTQGVQYVAVRRLRRSAMAQNLQNQIKNNMFLNILSAAESSYPHGFPLGGQYVAVRPRRGSRSAG